MVVGRISYSNRKVEGEKLASVVRKDLLKRIHAKSNHVKEAQTDILLSGKHLGAHLDLVCDSLVECVEAGAIRIGELHLEDNDLTVEALHSLQKVVNVSTSDFRAINLSRNNIQVVTELELGLWLAFLSALSSCRQVRSLNLSNNPLGNRAIELLSLTYCRETVQRRASDSCASVLPEITLSIGEESGLDLDAGHVSSGPDSGSEFGDTLSNGDSDGGSPQLSRSSTFSMHTGKMQTAAPPKGLRNLLSLRLDSVGMTDAGTLSLSSIIEQFQNDDTSISHTTEHTKSTLREVVPDPVESPARCSEGISYDNNDISMPAQKLLELARRSSETVQDAEHHSMQRSAVRRRSSAGKSPQRRRSSVGSEGGGKAYARPGASAEVERARVKVQGLVLKEDGPSALLLWSVALRCLELARILCSETYCVTAGRLPQVVWRRILTLACDPHSVLNPAQERAIFRWATDVSCVRTRREWDVKVDHIKLWRTLEAVGCLEHGR